MYSSHVLNTEIVDGMELLSGREERRINQNTNAYTSSYPPLNFENNNSDVPLNTRESKFCFLLNPAKSCCGCGLRSTIIFIAVFEIVCGILNMFSIMNSFLLQPYMLFSSVFNLILGVLTYRAANEFLYKYAKISYYMKLVQVVLTFVSFIVIVVLLLTEKAWFHFYINSIHKNNSNEQDLKLLEQNLLVMFYIFSIFSFFQVLLNFYILYIYWSFRIRLKKCQIFLIINGINPPNESPNFSLNQPLSQNFIAPINDGDNADLGTRDVCVVSMEMPQIT